MFLTPFRRRFGVVVWSRALFLYCSRVLIVRFALHTIRTRRVFVLRTRVFAGSGGEGARGIIGHWTQMDSDGMDADGRRWDGSSMHVVLDLSGLGYPQ